MVTFGNLKQEAGLKKLDDYLADRSYIEGYTASQSDVAVFEALSAAPAAKHKNALRWYSHIASHSASDRKALPGVKPVLDSAEPAKPAAAAKSAAPAEEDDDDVDLFGSDDEEDAEASRVREERLAAYADKKAKKPGPIAKSQILLDVKPWDDETDMKVLEEKVRKIEMDGLVWGAGELKPLAFGIRKLVILSTVVDDLVSVDDLTEKIQALEDFVQSVDIAAFNKV